MQKIRGIALFILGGVFSMFVSTWFNQTPDLDLKVVNHIVSPDITLTGYRNNTGNATAGFTYHYFFETHGVRPDKPFLISDSPDLIFSSNRPLSINLSISGKIYHMTNVVWVRKSDKLQPLNLNISVKSKL